MHMACKKFKDIIPWLSLICAFLLLFSITSASLANHKKTMMVNCAAANNEIMTAEQCRQQSTSVIELAVNETYLRTLKKFIDEPKRLLQLKQSQKLWRQYRESQCQLEQSLTNNATLAPLVESQCIKDMNQHRIAILKQLL